MRRSRGLDHVGRHVELRDVDVQLGGGRVDHRELGDGDHGGKHGGFVGADQRGAITDAAGTSLDITNNAALSGTAITLGDDAGDTTNFGSLTFTSGGAVSISEDSATEITGTNTADSLVLTSAGAITDAAGTSLTVTNNASLNGASITLGDDAGDTTNFGSLTFNSAGGVDQRGLGDGSHWSKHGGFPFPGQRRGDHRRGGNFADGDEQRIVQRDLDHPR